LHVQKPIITPSDFKQSLVRRKPPDGLCLALVALWWVDTLDLKEAKALLEELA
jgi:hypothetical protein